MNRKINSKPIPETTRLLLVAGIIIVGAVIRGSYPVLGHWVSMVGMAWYLLVAAFTWGKKVRNFSSLTQRAKAQILIAGVVLIVFVWSVFDANALNYFMIIVLFAVEYLLLDKEKDTKNT